MLGVVLELQLNCYMFFLDRARDGGGENYNEMPPFHYKEDNDYENKK